MGKLAEFLFVFILIPLVFYFDPVGIPKIPVLIAVTGIITFILFRDKSFDNKRFFSIDKLLDYLPKILLRFIIIALLLFFFVYFYQPWTFLKFPHYRPWLWALVMLLYPALSAYTQEIVYRAFFFHRYGKLVGSGWIMILSNALVFAFLHIIYDNWIAIGFSLLGGILFARTYRDTGSILVAAIEHGIYGGYVFTVGLGLYFYEGPRT